MPSFRSSDAHHATTHRATTDDHFCVDHHRSTSRSMNRVGRSVTTGTGITVLVTDHFIEQRLSPFARITLASISEDRKARRAVSGDEPCVVLIVIPASVPIESETTNVDHFRSESQDRSIIALAVVVADATASAVNKFYFRYYPQAFKVRVFDLESEARDWLNQELIEHFAL